MLLILSGISSLHYDIYSSATSSQFEVNENKSSDWPRTLIKFWNYVSIPLNSVLLDPAHIAANPPPQRLSHQIQQRQRKE